MGNRFLNAGRVRKLDVFIVVWCVFWVVVAVFAAADIRNMDKLPTTVVDVTDGLKKVTDGLSGLAAMPLIGGGIGNLVGEIDHTVTNANGNATSTRDSIDRVAVYAGLSVALIPSVLMLVFYAPFRLPWREDRRAITAALALDPNDEVLDEYLARRAIDALPYDRLRALGENPWRMIEAGEFGVLADAELARLGVRRP
jgi:hypothetical protein